MAQATKEHPMKHAALAAVLAALAAGTLAVAAGGAMGGPVIKLKDKQLGPILATPRHQALYYWSVEKKAGFKVRCTGGCAKLWPPLVVKSAGAVPRRLEGLKGALDTVRRPDGKLQVTYNRLPVYTYAHEGPNQVLCDNVDGWFVVRV
jgi:predicted lipoprotein with Yx(FWY)xxD motif